MCKPPLPPTDGRDGARAAVEEALDEVTTRAEKRDRDASGEVLPTAARQAVADHAGSRESLASSQARTAGRGSSTSSSVESRAEMSVRATTRPETTAHGDHA